MEAKKHWIVLRFTAIAAIPLCVWLVYSIVSLAGSDYAAFTAWLKQPLNAILLIVFIVMSFYHSMLGIQEIIEDYVHAKGAKCAAMLACNGFHILAAIGCIAATVKIAFMN